ncbi:MFS transporter [Amycolatopsis sp.]|uniref:MFS transporter n=1 Tax=Amycolatopsis sp. TaxID=37632 RepID=UPI002B975A4E|nr:MFS transporter [Amycolatopsis sp.]HVV12186.1 MFS transporter [Amycolatopsis sp.]
MTLCATEITSWCVLYLRFSRSGREDRLDDRWSAAAVTAGFSPGQLVTASAGIMVGRWLDRHDPRRLMTGGSVLAVPAVVALAAARNLVWFLAAWVLMGLAMGATLYPPAFAALTRWYGPRRVAALTLAAGLASTVFAPLSAFLNAHPGWRHAYLVLAGILAVVTIPGHLWGLRGAWPGPAPHECARPAEHHDPGRAARSRAFLLLVVTLSLAAFTAYAVVVNLVPLLTERGLTPGLAAVALGLGGAGQVLGRLGYTTLVRRTSGRDRTALVVGAVALTTGILGLHTSAPVLIGAAVIAGVAREVFTLVQATAAHDQHVTRPVGRGRDRRRPRRLPPYPALS